MGNQVREEVEAGERFEFSRNWARFLSGLDQSQIESAVRSLQTTSGDVAGWLEEIVLAISPFSPMRITQARPWLSLWRAILRFQFERLKLADPLA